MKIYEQILKEVVKLWNVEVALLDFAMAVHDTDLHAVCGSPEIMDPWNASIRKGSNSKWKSDGRFQYAPLMSSTSLATLNVR